MAENSDDQLPEHGRDKLDTTSEFFSVGTPLHAVRAGYVRRGADNLLFENIRTGRYAHIIAPDRSGKSSLVAATAARLENNGFKVAVLDLEQIGVRDAGSDEGRWYYSIAYRLLRQLRIRIDLQTWWQDKSILSNQQRLVEFYSEIVLQNVQERIVVFVDEIQCIDALPFSDQLLPSIRAAHNARATDPEFARLTFVLLGECDPLSLIDEPELSPFNVTQPVTLNDFSRSDLDLFAAELNLAPHAAGAALDRIYYWTGGQPYLTQKLARAVSRERFVGDVGANVDRLAIQQLAGRAALHNEPHMSHIHREIVKDGRRCEGLLTLYGRIRKGVHVATDLGSPLQRRLIAIGLLRIDDEGNLRVRNRLYEAVFTARWANEHLPTHWRTPAIAAAVVLLMLALPFWYTQLLPRSYVDELTSTTVDLEIARKAYLNLRSFPGHADAADNLLRSFVRTRAELADSTTAIEAVAVLAAELPDAARLPDELRAGFWDRQVRAATRAERRDDALLAALESLVLSTSARRNRAAAFVADDYPLLLASVREPRESTVVLNPAGMLLTTTRGAEVVQWSLDTQGLHRRESWSITALEVSALVRRVMVDREGQVSRVGLTLNLSHARVGDLRIKIIAPSGRTVEVDPGVERASSNQDLRIPPSQLQGLVGEPLAGTWSISVRDEALGVAGQLVGWNLVLNSQGAVEDFQRGLNISDPVERETDNLWFSSDGRYAVARAMQSDSARIWDLAFANPVRAVAVNELEQLVGLSRGARLLVTATQDTINLWDTATGHRVATLPVGAASPAAMLTEDGTRLLAERRGDIETTFELWSLEEAAIADRLVVAGTPALVAVDRDGSRIAVADYDRAVRVWDVGSGAQLAQVDLDAQPSRIVLAADGQALGVVYGEGGASLWRIDRPQRPLLEYFGEGSWQLTFAPSGTLALIGRNDEGFRVFETETGRRIGPLLGSGGGPGPASLLAFTADEQIVVTGGPDSVARFWRAPTAPARNIAAAADGAHTIWPPSGSAVAIASPDASWVAIGDEQGDVHVLPVNPAPELLAVEANDVSFFGHNSAVRRLAVSDDGRRIASAAADNTLRVWDAADRVPLPFIGDLPGEPVRKLEFSPDGALLGALTAYAVAVLDTESGDVLARFDLGEAHRALAFADSDHLYVGSESGGLDVVLRDASGQWSVQSAWQGDAGIRWLEASADGRSLVLVDGAGLARLFTLLEGRIGDEVLQLPGDVQEVVFAPGGSRILIRTTGWLHRASVSVAGLRWIDAVLAPKMIPGARMVFGDDLRDHSGGRVYLPVAGDEFVSLEEIRFSADRGTGLFGNRERLIEVWKRRLGLAVVTAQRPDEQL